MERLDNITEDQKYRAAKKRLEEIKGFYWHLFSGVLVLPMLVIINWLTTDFPWALFPIGAYLLSLLIHWFVVFKRGSIFSRQWEERKLKEFMDEDNKEQRQLYN